MRVIIVGTVDERHELVARAAAASFDVVAEFESVADARASGLQADAILVPPPRRSRGGAERRDVDALTPREFEVLELVAQGLANKAIAARLQISDQTVKFHVGSITGKLGAANRTDAVRRAVRAGLITL